MKRRITAIATLAVLLLCGVVWARITTVVVGKSVSGGSTTSYSNTGGSGNRTSIITLTTYALSNNLGTDILDGTTNSSTSYFATVECDGTRYMQFDFGSGHSPVIDEAKYYQENTTAQGTWQIQGSANGSDFTNIGSTFSLGGVATQTITAPSGNTTGYRYYRWSCMSGSTSNAPWVYEIEFKISGY